MLEVIVIIIVYLIKVIKIEKDVNYKVPRFFFWIWIGKDVNLNSKVPRLKRVIWVYDHIMTSTKKKYRNLNTVDAGA